MKTAQELLDESAKLNSIVTQLERHGALNSENMPLVAKVLRRYSTALTRQAFSIQDAPKLDAELSQILDDVIAQATNKESKNETL